jgi:hypothetical protein
MRPTHSAALVGLSLMLAMTACQASPEEQAKARQAAMIAQAQADAAREQAFVADSVKLAATFTVDTVARPLIMHQRSTVEDEDGDSKDTTVALHIIQGRHGGFCNNMDPKLWAARAVGDTLTCQWTRRAEGIPQEDSQ